MAQKDSGFSPGTGKSSLGPTRIGACDGSKKDEKEAAETRGAASSRVAADTSLMVATVVKTSLSEVRDKHKIW